MTPQQFIAKWKAAELKERAACQEHFLNVCELLGQPTPADADPTGEWYTFEKGVDKDTGGQGFADVWRRGFFGWEYKGKRKNLADAYRQLSQYREALANPPLLIVCDLNRFEIHTNFTGTVKEVHAFDLDGLAEPENLAKLRNAFTNPDALKPGRTQAQVTEEVAEKFVELADGLRKRKIEPHAAGHFLMKLMFCMFAEDIGLLPEKLFEDTVKKTKWEPEKLSKALRSLFDAMAKKDSLFGGDEVPWINGGLFQDADVIELERREIQTLAEVAGKNWANIEPSIFGTLFERILNPDKRSQLGAHYTSRADIETLLEPVMMAPLRREWADVKAKADKLWIKIQAQAKKKAEDTKRGIRRNEIVRKGTQEAQQLRKLMGGFLDRLAKATVLDPACGSGNFLYVALNLLLDLEKEVMSYSNLHGVPVLIPGVRPTQLHGIELNPYAQELAQVVIWIGYLQWMKFNGFVAPSDPVLDAMTNIENRDAILDLSDPENPKEPEWPAAEFIVGNPPFLGSSLFRERGIPDEYTEALSDKYGLHGKSDLCCYWFAKANKVLSKNPEIRVGLIATQTIRHGGSKAVLQWISEHSHIWFAISDQEWVLDGANVRVAIIGYGGKNEDKPLLDGRAEVRINADLTAGQDTGSAKLLDSNEGLVFEGDQKGGPFEVSLATSIAWFTLPNPSGRPNSDVLLPRVNADELVKTRKDMGWIVDFGCDLPIDSAALYEQPFEYVKKYIFEARQSHAEISRRTKWWIHKRPRPEMRKAIQDLPRYFVTPRVGKHRLFIWLSMPTLADR